MTRVSLFSLRVIPSAVMVMLGVYNPLNLTGPFGGHEVSHALRQLDFLAVPGTGIRAGQGEPVRVQELDDHLAVHWGHRGGQFYKCLGITIMVHKKRFRRAHIVEVITPPDTLQGRAGQSGSRDASWMFA